MAETVGKSYVGRRVTIAQPGVPGLSNNHVELRPYSEGATEERGLWSMWTSVGFTPETGWANRLKVKSNEPYEAIRQFATYMAGFFQVVLYKTSPEGNGSVTTIEWHPEGWKPLLYLQLGGREAKKISYIAPSVN